MTRSTGICSRVDRRCPGRRARCEENLGRSAARPNAQPQRITPSGCGRQRRSGTTRFRSATAASARWCSGRSIASGFSSTKRRCGWAAARTDNPEALAALPEVRRLLFAGQPREAYALAERKMMGKPWRLESYQSLGDLRLTFDHEGEITDYRRELDLDAAIARVTYRVDGVRYTREVFASHPDRVIVVRLTVDRPGALTFGTWIDRQQDARTEIAGNDRLESDRPAVGTATALSFLASAQDSQEGGTQETFPERILVDGRERRDDRRRRRHDRSRPGNEPLARDVRVATRRAAAAQAVSPQLETAHSRRSSAVLSPRRRCGLARQADSALSSAPTDERLDACRAKARSDPGARRALFPVRPLSSDREQPARAICRPTCRGCGTTA